MTEKTIQEIMVIWESADGEREDIKFNYESYDFASIQEHARYLLRTHSNKYLNFEEAFKALVYSSLEKLGYTNGTIKGLAAR